MPDISQPLKLSLTATQANQTALDLLSSGSGLSKQRIKDAMNKGAVWWTHKGKTLRLRRATKTLNKGAVLQLFYNEQVLSRAPEPALLIADNSRYSVWYKPHGLLAQGSQWGDHCSLLRWVELHLEPKRECFLVHRLDADAAGLMIIAHDSQSAARLSLLFQERDMRKYYQAWVEGLPPISDEELTLNASLDGKHAITHLRPIALDSQRQHTLLDIRIETGRKHQIRRHLSSWGHPIVGDKLYGNASQQPLQLLAYRLQFTCPFNKTPVHFELPVELTFRMSEEKISHS